MNECYPNSFDLKMATEKGLAKDNELTENFEMLEKNPQLSCEYFIYFFSILAVNSNQLFT